VILNDPQVRGLARRRAGSLDLAEDALQETYYAIARVPDPAAIADLRAYFVRTLIREIFRQHRQLGATPTGDVTDLAELDQAKSYVRVVQPRPVDEVAGTRILAESWLRPFTAQRGRLLSSVPGRSGRPARYREAIVGVAEHVVRACLLEKITDADCNTLLGRVYPEWFTEPGCAENTRYKRLERGRADIRALLKGIIDPDDLKS